MRVVLLPIKPRYAEAIVGGVKKVEFRKAAFPLDAAVVVIYASRPVQRIVAYFEVTQVEEATPSVLWRRYSHVGGISQSAFRAYFNGSRSGKAIRVGRLRELPEPLLLAVLGENVSPPQSHAYLSAREFEAIRDKAGPFICT